MTQLKATELDGNSLSGEHRRHNEVSSNFLLHRTKPLQDESCSRPIVSQPTRERELNQESDTRLYRLDYAKPKNVFRPKLAIGLACAGILLIGLALYLYRYGLAWIVIFAVMYLLINYKVFVLVCPECDSPLNSQYLFYTPKSCWNCGTRFSKYSDPTEHHQLKNVPGLQNEGLVHKETDYDIENTGVDSD